MKKRIIATILSIALIFTSVPWTAVDVFAQTTLDVVNQVVDPDTTNDWKAYFGVNGGNVSTEYAGGVWTDKSVFAYDPADDKTLDGVSFTVAEDNFLVATSAISSTKQITGFEYLPTDTVFVLDVSGSMDSSELQDMVKAANIAITELLTLNSYNRVGVVAYNPQVATLLEIDRYTTTKTAVDDKDTDDTSDDETYNVYLEYSSGYLTTARTSSSNTELFDINWETVLNGYTGNNWGGNNGGNNWDDNWGSQDSQSIKDYLTSDSVWNTYIKNNVPSNYNKNTWERLIENVRTWGNNAVDTKAEWLAWLNENAGVTTTSLTYHVSGTDVDENGSYLETGTKATGDGTYTQLGIYQGRTLFEGMYGDTTIDTGLIQGGTKRIPIMVLMTDGAPTYGKSDYTFANNTTRDMGNGSTVTWELAFTTQATAAHTLSVMERVYDREGLFYTLGLGVQETQATSVLDPANNTSTELTGWWNTYKTGTTTTLFTYGNNNNSVTVSRQETSYTRDPDDTSLTNISISEMVGSDTVKGNFPYADRYFPASDSTGLVDAFDKIVEQIKIQSKYYPTLVTTGEYDMDGYVTIVDELGEYMEVKDIKGLLYNNTLHSGAKLIAAMYNGTYGNRTTWTELGWKLVYSIRERFDVAATGDNVDGDATEYGTPIEVTNSVVTTLLSQAWADGQLGGTYSDNGTSENLEDDTVTDFSNYISYYVNAKGQYLGFHAKNHTEADYPVGTKYIGYSYVFSGNITGTTSSIANTEMMHIVVQVYEDVSDTETKGHQTVTWRVPAALIPTVMYEISVEGNQLTESTVETIKYTGDTPIRLVYEVGLNDELTPINIVEKLTAEGAHAHPTTDGGYYFYSNRWGDGKGVTELDPNNHKATVAHYSPSVENERYYYTEDTILYINVNGSYVPYTGTAQPSDMYPNDNTDSGYYRPVHVISGAESTTGASASLTTKYVPVAASVLSDTSATKQATDGTNQWYVVKGTIYQQTARDRVYKATNTTETLEYVDYPVIAHPTGSDTDYAVFLFHGNNGRLKVMPATGIKLTKEVDTASTVTGAVHNFEFVITLDKAPTALKITDEDYEELPAEDYTVNGNTITVKNVTDGETVYITGLAEDTTYTVTESANRYYTIQSVSAETVTEKVAGGVAELYEIDDVKFVNTAASFKGNLQIAKTVTHPYGDSYVIPTGKVFDVTVQFATQDSAVDITDVTFAATGTVEGGTAIDSVTTDENGTVTLKLAHEDSVTIIDLPDGVTYTVSEDSLPTGFANTGSTGLTGTIVSNQTSYAYLINNYTPVYPTSENLDIYITKNLEGITWETLDENAQFEFLLEKYEPSTQTWVNTGRQLVVNKDTENQTVVLDGTTTKVPFQYLGTHYYRLSEVADTVDYDGITYDATHAYFRVVVTDVDMDGYAEMDVVAANNTTVEEPTAENGNVHIVKAEFTNRYNSAVANISIHKNLTNNTGVDVAMDNFTFVLCTSADCTGNSECPAAANHIEVKPNINGDVIIPKTYTKDSVTGAAEVSTTYAEFDASVEYVVNPSNELEATRTATVKATESSVKTLVETYYLKEAAGSIAGMTYDSDVIPVEVTVTVTEAVTYDVTKEATYTRTLVPVVDADGNPVYVQQTDGEGNPVVDDDGNPVYVQQTEYSDWTLVGSATHTGEKPTDATPVVTIASTVKYNNDASLTKATFDNEYKLDPAKTTISGTKTYNRDMTAGQFTFNLYETDSTFTVAENAQAKDTATVDAETATGNLASDVFSFAEITYEKAGTYYYVVKEAMPAGATAANNYTVNGITYDPTVYHVTVTVGLDSTDATKLAAATPVVNQVGGSGTSVVFANTYSITSGTTQVLKANKALTGRALNKDDFTFHLYSTDSTFAVADGAAALQTVTNSAYNTVNGNTYTGTVQFEAIEYDAPGTYYYTIVEDTSAAKGGIKYDDTPSVDVTVVVKDNGDGTLTVESVTYSGNATIENTYEPTPVTKTITGTKLYASNSPFEALDVNETFKFALYKADKNYTPEATAFETVDAIKTAVKGYVDFSIPMEFKSAGDYYYVLREVAGSVPTTAYDSRVYHISVTVTDNGLGVLSAVPHIYLNGTEVTTTFGGDGYDFLNLYYPQEARASVQVNKTVENTTGVELSKQGFRFGLYETLEAAQQRDNDYVATGLTDENGDAYVELTFTDSDITDHTGTVVKEYYLAEMYADKDNNFVADIIGGMEYDQDIYKVTVTVKYDNGVLTATVDSVQPQNASGDWDSAISTPVSYTNIYDLTEATLNIPVEKELSGRTLVDGEFSFALYNASIDSLGNWVKGAQVGTNVSNVGNTVTFKQLEYNTIGTRHYIVEEVVPAQADRLKNVEYDETQYRVTVSVTDNGAGALEAEITEINGAAGDKIVFKNTFTPDPITVEITGTKKLNNRAPLEGEFEFAIYQADEDYNIVGSALATTRNAADGTFTFTNEMLGTSDLLKFEDAATRKFVVKEVVPESKDPTITYSTFEHNVEVKVTKRADGQLVYSVTDATGTSLDLVIENTYTTKSTTVHISLEKTLTNETGVNPGVSVKDFTFGLYTNEACTVPYTRNGNHVTVSPDDDGNLDTAVIIIPYTDASYTTATEYTYYLKEIIPAAANRVPMMDYDNSVYKVVVTLSYDGNNNLVAEPVITKVRDAEGAAIAAENQTTVSTATFNNVYDLGKASITLEGTKVYEGWTNGTNDDEQFTFELYQTGVSGNYAATGSQLIGTATVGKADPNFTFTSAGATAETTDNAAPQLEFTKAGTYYFVVRENKGGLTLVDADGHGIIYSGTQYVVAVKVSENVVNGKVTGLKAEKVVYHYGNKPEGLDDAASFEGFASDNIRFTNIDLDGKATIDFVGKKAIENANMADYDQAFDFVLYEAEVNGSTWTLVDSKPDTTAVDPLLSTENREKEEEQENNGYNIEFIGVPLEYAGDGSHTYHFVVKELNGGHPTIGYDAAEYKITVTAAFKTVVENGATKHNYEVTSVVVNGQPVQFTTTAENNSVIVLLTGDNGNAFENTYTSFSTTAEIPVEKVLHNNTGVAMGEDGFVFGLYTDEACTTPYTVNGTQVTATTGADGKATISISYTDKDVSVTPHVYYLKEIAGTTLGMAYSQQVYKVAATVAFDTTGTETVLKATPVISTVDAAARLVVNRAEFENTYALDSATLGFKGIKVIDTRVISSYDYRFELYKATLSQPDKTVIADANGVWAKGSRIEEVANTAQSGINAKDYDVFKFSDLTFDKAGTYHYILVEQKGANSSIIYDETAYQITVTVAPSATKAELEAKVTKVQKVEYSFDTGYLDSEMVFEGVTEKDSSGNAWTENDFVFTNIYRPLGTFTVGGEKVLENRDWKSGDSFTFEMYYANADGTLIDAYKLQDGVNPILTETVSYNAQGEYSFSFKDIIVSYIGVDGDKNAQIGTQYFVIKEKAESLPAMSYDTTEYLIKVDKKDNGDGTLAVGSYDGTTFTEDDFVVTKVKGADSTVLEPTDAIKFINGYNTVMTVPTEAVIKGEKAISNANISDYDGKFTFELYKADSSWAYSSDDLVATTTNDANGSFEFSNSDYITFNAAGTYYFVVKEQKGANPAIVYDTREYKVEIVVEDTGVTDGKAVLEVTSVNYNSFNEIKFTNSYNPATLTININKALTFKNGATHPLSGFEFNVYDVVEDKSYTAVSNSEGKQTVTIHYNENHLDGTNPKVYTYKITEVDTKIEGMEYDPTEYVIEVTVYAENGHIKTKITQQDVYIGITDSTSVQFNNTYKGKKVPENPEDPGTPVVIVPNTGDNSSNMLYIGLMAVSAMCAAGIFFVIKKRKEEEESEA